MLSRNLTIKLNNAKCQLTHYSGAGTPGLQAAGACFHQGSVSPAVRQRLNIPSFGYFIYFDTTDKTPSKEALFVIFF